MFEIGNVDVTLKSQELGSKNPSAPQELASSRDEQDKLFREKFEVARDLRRELQAILDLIWICLSHGWIQLWSVWNVIFWVCFKTQIHSDAQNVLVAMEALHEVIPYSKGMKPWLATGTLQIMHRYWEMCTSYYLPFKKVSNTQHCKWVSGFALRPTYPQTLSVWCIYVHLFLNYPNCR